MKGKVSWGQGGGPVQSSANRVGGGDVGFSSKKKKNLFTSRRLDSQKGNMKGGKVVFLKRRPIDSATPEGKGGVC